MKYFVSYSRQDSEIVKKIALDLKVKYMDVWLDQVDIPVGTKWDTCIEHALTEAEGFILMLSTSSVSSDNVMDEVNFAITKGKHIIPVLLDDCEVPFRIARIQMIDSRGDYDKCIEAIVDTTHDRGHVTLQNLGIDNAEAFFHPEEELRLENATKTSPAKPVVTAHSYASTIVHDTTDNDANTNDKPFVYHRTGKRRKPHFALLFIAAALVLFFLWLFTTSSGGDLYSSALASLTDISFLDMEKHAPGIFIIVIVGAIAGWIAVLVIDSESSSLLLDVAVGIAGGFIATKWIFHGIWELTDYYYVNLIITTTVGAALLAIVIKFIRRAAGF